MFGGVVQSVAVSLAFVALGVVIALVGLHLVRLRFPHHVRQANNEVAGFLIAVLGVVSGVVLGFVVVVVWEQYEAAKLAAEREAIGLVDLYRLAQAFPEPTGSQLREMAEEYVVLMIEEEWPSMARGEFSQRGRIVLDEMWRSGTMFEAATERERLVQEKLVDTMREINDERRLRQLMSRNGLPAVMWALLIGGAIVTVLFTYFFSTPNEKVQYAMIGLYVASVTFVLVLIGLLDFPFRGDVRVSPEAFELALESFQRLDSERR
jgi:hypothetical protein